MLCDFKNCKNKQVPGSNFCAAHKGSSVPAEIQKEVQDIHSYGKGYIARRLTCKDPDCDDVPRKKLGYCNRHQPRTYGKATNKYMVVQTAKKQVWQEKEEAAKEKASQAKIPPRTIRRRPQS